MEDNYRATFNMDSKLRRERSNFKFNDSHTLTIGEAPVYMGPEYICDPNAEDPTKPVPGLFKILPKGLAREELVGMVFDFDLSDIYGDDETARKQNSRGGCSVAVAAATSFDRVKRQPATELQFALQGSDRDSTPHTYYPESGYLGNDLLNGIVFLDTGDVDLVDNTWVAAGTSLLTPREILDIYTDYFIYLIVDNAPKDGSEVDNASGSDTEVTLTLLNSEFQIKISEDKTVQFKSTASRLRGTHSFYLQGAAD